jgi:predicted transcriptional regulator
MSIVKEEAKKLVESLPDDATWDDLMYQIYVRTKIEEGLAADEAGDVVPQEEVEKRFAGQ